MQYTKLFGFFFTSRTHSAPPPLDTPPESTQEPEIHSLPSAHTQPPLPTGYPPVDEDQLRILELLKQAQPIETDTNVLIETSKIPPLRRNLALHRLRDADYIQYGNERLTSSSYSVRITFRGIQILLAYYPQSPG